MADEQEPTMKGNVCCLSLCTWALIACGIAYAVIYHSQLQPCEYALANPDEPIPHHCAATYPNGTTVIDEQEIHRLQTVTDGLRTALIVIGVAELVWFVLACCCMAGVVVCTMNA